MEPSTQKNFTEDMDNFDELLKDIDRLLLQSYEKFYHEVIVRGISHYNFDLNRLSHCLWHLHKETMDDIVQKALSYYDDFAPADIKYYGMDNCA